MNRQQPAETTAGGLEGVGQQLIQVDCPHCRSPVEVCAAQAPEIDCSTCGVRFRVDSDRTASWHQAQNRQLGKFTLLEQVGRGAFGTVYRAHDSELDRVVAIKVPRGGRFTLRDEEDRFVREARTAAQLRHPGIVSIYDVGRAEDLPYIVAEFVHGITLADALSGRRFSFREAADLIAQIAEALEHAHRNGVVHRDLKPSNVMLEKVPSGHESASGVGQSDAPTRRSGSTARHSDSPRSTLDVRPRVMDFGLARREEGELTVTVEGQVLGTPAYMSPEQARGEGHGVDGRTDVYSLGVMLYELLTGALPFRGNHQMLLFQVIHDLPQPPRKLDNRVPRDLETICLKCLSKEPARRYATSGDLAADLNCWLRGEPIAARPVGALERSIAWIRRHRLLTGSITAIAATLVGASVVSTLFAVHADRSARQAQASEAKAKQEESLAFIAAKEARQSAAMARQREQEARWSAYVPDMNLAFQAYESGYIGRANELLERHVPEADQPDLRGAEWYLLWSLCHGDEAVLYGHRGAVHSVDWSSDGATIASAGEDGNVVLWNASQHTQQRRFRPHEGPIRAVAFSPDSKLLATASSDGLVKIWKADTLELQRSLFVMPNDDIHLKFSPDGKLLAAGNYMGEWCYAMKRRDALRVWDTATWRERLTPAPRLHQFGALAFSPDSQRLAAVGGVWSISGQQQVVASVGDDPAFSQDGSLVIASDPVTHGGRQLTFTNVGTGSTTVSPRDWPARCLPATPGGRFVVSRSGLKASDALQQGALRQWDFVARREGPPLVGHEGGVAAFAYAPDGQRIVSAGRDGTVRIWRLEPQDDLPPAHTAGVLTLSASPDNGIVATGSIDRTVKLWEAGTGRLIQSFGNGEVVLDVAFSPDGHRLATVCNDAGIGLQIWDIAGVATRVLRGPNMRFASVDYAPDGRTLAVGGWGKETGDVKLLAADTGAVLANLRPHRDTIHALKFSNDGKLIATGSEDNVACLIEASSKRVLHRLTGHSGPVRDVAFSRDGALLATASADNSVRVWDTATGAQRGRIVGRPHTSGYGVAFVGNSLLVAVFRGARSSALASYNVNGEIRLVRYVEWPGAVVDSLAIPDDASWLATGLADGRTLLSDVHTFQRQGQLGEQLGWFCTAFSPDGKTLALGGHGSVRFLDAATRTEKKRLTGLADTVRGLSYSPDGKWLAASMANLKGNHQKNPIVIWDAQTLEEVGGLPAVGCSLVAFSPNGKWLVGAPEPHVSGGLHQLHVWDVRGWKQSDWKPAAASVHSIAGVHAGIGGLQFLQGGSVLALGGSRFQEFEDQRPSSVAIWDLGKQQTVITLRAHPASIADLATVSDGQRLISAGFDRTLRIWDLRTAALERVVPIAGTPRRLVPLPGGRLAVGCLDGTIHVWELKTWQETAVWQAHSSPQHLSTLSDLVLSPDGRTLVSTSSSPDDIHGNVRFWSLAHRQDVDRRLADARKAGWARTTIDWPIRSEYPLRQAALDHARSQQLIDEPAYLRACQLLRTAELQLTQEDRDCLALVVEACDGGLAWTDLSQRLAEVEPQEKRDARVRQQQIQAVQAARAQLIEELLAEARASDNPLEGARALEVLWHLRRLEPAHQEVRPLEQKIAAYYPVKTKSNSLGQTLVKLRTGTFQLGSPGNEAARDLDEQVHPVRLDRNVFLSSREVTLGQFAAFVADSGYVTAAERALVEPDRAPTDATAEAAVRTWRNPGFEQTDEHPVVCVSWNDAAAFCQWLADKEGLKYRLPTEAEWENAIRMIGGNPYPWGSKFEAGEGWANVADQGSGDFINTNPRFPWSDGAKATAPVGSYRANAWNLHDLVGNVREWCQDRYGAYPYLLTINPTGPALGHQRVIRGGSWRSSPADCRSAARDALPPDQFDTDLGFRILLDESP